MPSSERESSHYWPVLNKHALGKAEPGETPIKGVCPVCNDDLCIAGLPWELPEGQGREYEENHACMINPCGHVMCVLCEHEWTTATENEEESKLLGEKLEIECPVCRLKIGCFECGNKCHVQQAPLVDEGTDKFDAIPFTVPEGGDFKPECRDCIMSDSFMGAFKAKDASIPDSLLEKDPALVMFITKVIASLHDGVKRSSLKRAVTQYQDNPTVAPLFIEVAEAYRDYIKHWDLLNLTAQMSPWWVAYEEE